MYLFGNWAAEPQRRKNRKQKSKIKQQQLPPPPNQLQVVARNGTQMRPMFVQKQNKSTCCVEGDWGGAARTLDMGIS